MSQRPAPGRTPARDADAPLGPDGRPSKSSAKREAHDLQSLGVDLVGLPDGRLAALEIPESLRSAIAEYRRTKSHEGRRRQMQYIGKLMRQTDEAPLREAVAASRLGSAQETLQLHQIEHWRDRLLADDEALTRWVEEHPDCDVQQLRALVRAAAAPVKADPAAATGPGQSPRQARAYRELFQFIKAAS